MLQNSFNIKKITFLYISSAVLSKSSHIRSFMSKFIKQKKSNFFWFCFPYLHTPRTPRSAARPPPPQKRPAASLRPRRSAAASAAPPAWSIRPAGTPAAPTAAGRAAAAPLWSLPCLWPGTRRQRRRRSSVSARGPALAGVPGSGRAAVAGGGAQGKPRLTAGGLGDRRLFLRVCGCTET